MIEILDNTMVYVTTNEKALVERLYRIKNESAVYYNKNGKKAAYHWFLNPITIKRLNITPK